LRSGHRVWVVGMLPTLETNEVPPVLPPPPLPDTGWSDTTYNSSWAARTEYYLIRHGSRFDSLSDDRDHTPYLQENLQLFVAQGWRD
jgi:hypothetical protein